MGQAHYSNNMHPVFITVVENTYGDPRHVVVTDLTLLQGARSELLICWVGFKESVPARDGGSAEARQMQQT